MGPSVSSGPTRQSSKQVYPENPKRKWKNIMAIFIGIVVVAEIGYMAINAASVNSFLHNRSSSSNSNSNDNNDVSIDGDDHKVELSDDDVKVRAYGKDGEKVVCCESWLEMEDTVVYGRDFDKDPVLVAGAAQEWKTCAVGCKFGYDPLRKADAGFGWPQNDGMAAVHRSMESSQYYAENNLDNARRRGYDITMTTSLSSDVPVGYFSWAEYDIMAPLQPKTESALAAAFISNCGARNFRLQALETLEKIGVSIDSYGSCHRNHDGQVDKVETLKRYKFSLAFENSNEEDYVTEKFFQSLVAGNIPVVVGAPNIQDFAPGPGSVLHIKELKDVDSVAKKMKYLAGNPDAFNQSLRWKYEGPSDSFKALVDMAAVHSSCRLCIHLATRIHADEEKRPGFKKRPCKCTRGSETTYHLYVRERGRFETESIFLRSSNLTMEALEAAVMKKFSNLRHVPIWKTERPESITGGDELKIYRIYPVGLTQRQALYSFKFEGVSDFRSHIDKNPCAKFELIFV